MITVVSGYVHLPNSPRPMEEYRRLGERLLNINHRVIFYKGDLQDCWLHNHLDTEYGMDTSKFSYSVADNPKKNSLEYHIVQAEKTQWLERALARDEEADVFVWIDFGIFHVPGVTEAVIDNFLDRADGERTLTIPGCWEKGSFKYDDRHPCWRFCGGVMVVPRSYVQIFNWAMKREYTRWLKETGNISWEVNALARLEQHGEGFPLWWYAADHDQTLFTNYRASKQFDRVH